MIFRAVFILILFFTSFLYSQSLTDTIGNEKKGFAGEEKKPVRETKPFSLFNPTFKGSESLFLPLNLKIYNKVFSNDYSEPLKFLPEEIESGMNDAEIIAFRNNKNQLKKELTEFYGEDLINIEKLLKSLGLTKEQVVMIAAIFKLIFAQSLLPVPR